MGQIVQALDLMRVQIAMNQIVTDWRLNPVI